ncbi:NAD-dependent epimerase/dehydratase family protein [uncultured Methanobrevibacter sp.]|uniref:NAD-dependent epimerase/dehydratase family protein n=1 Tax=uncultured Methanobrevibacter sp. TaxID=253161 RepID=UPI0025ED2A62|nr:NAD-dependent epimerase/dehydratase family protein [uncultured Methanobrevibacter sp.]
MIELNGFKIQTILVTGAAGLIGANFVKHLILCNSAQSALHCCKMIVGVDAMEPWGNDNIIPENNLYKFYKMNCSSEKIEELFKKYNFDYVYHFAAYAAEGLSPFMRRFNYKNNILSTVNIINNCIKYKTTRLIYTSSMSVYGNGVKPGEKFDEKDLPLPIDPYAISKYACELDIKNAGEQHGLDWCIIRPHNVFGIYQNVNDKYRNVLGIWMHQLISNEPLSIYGDGNQTRAFTVVNNICNCLYTAGFSKKCSKEIINLGGEYGYTINELADIFCNIINVDRNKFVYYEARNEVKHAVPTNDKARSLLGYNEFISIEDGLLEMWNWVLETNKVKEWYEWNKFELDEKIYSYWKN